MKAKLFQLLEENKIIPVNKETWNFFEIEHNETNYSNRGRIKEFIALKTKNANGLYLYKNKSDEILYIGKAKPLKNRLYSHFCETYEQLKGDRSGKWHRFFNTHKGKLQVYWIELEDEDVRVIVERLLSAIYNPLFEMFEKR